MQRRFDGSKRLGRDVIRARSKHAGRSGGARAAAQLVDQAPLGYREQPRAHRTRRAPARKRRRRIGEHLLRELFRVVVISRAPQEEPVHVLPVTDVCDFG